MSQITTHVLDTAKGTPAEGINIALQKPIGENQWEDIVTGVTNSDGRIPGFMSEDLELVPGIYRMWFDTASYFQKESITGFYPEIPVIFEIKDTQHYHIPLLLSPFGYSTYRGS